MNVNENWREVKALFRDSFRSSFHYADRPPVTSAALELAKTWNGVAHIDVGVSENSPSALRIYQSLGFIEWGREPESTQHVGQRYDEVFLSLRVERSTGA